METTRQHQQAIRRFLDRLKRRERSQLAGEAVSRGITAVAVLSLAAGIGLSIGVAAGTVGLVLVSMGAAVVWLSIWLPGRGRWAESGDPMHHARRIEARLPGLRGRLITAVEPAGGADVGSSVLLERASLHALRATTLIEPADIHPKTRSVRHGAGMVLALFGVLMVGRTLPVGPLDAYSVLFGASAASLRLAEGEVVEDESTELVGDITLRYVFPHYTGLESREVPNSDGTIIAPPGTRVQIRARTASLFDAAAVQIEGEEPVDAVLIDGRDLTASLTVESSSTWKFILFEGKNVSLSKSYELRVEADSPPVVVISESGQAVVPVDAPLGLGWNVTDDYGVVRVSFELDKGDGPTSQVRREPISPALELSGTERATPRSLGLSPGDSVTLRVVAVDNDRATGGNRGESEPLQLEVLGPRGYGKNLTEYYKKLRDAMLSPLADFLEEAVPPVNTRRELVRWASVAPARLDAMRTVVEEQWGSQQSSGIDGELVSDVLAASARLFRFTLTTFDRATDGIGQQPVSSDLDTFGALHEATILNLETAVFVIDNMLREVGVAELARQARRVAESAGEISEEAQKTEDAAALHAELDRLERQLSQLRKAASKLSDQALSDFTNSTLDQTDGLIGEIREALSSGKTEAAREMLETLADQLAQLAESLDDRQQRSQQADDEMGERFKALMEDLEQLATDQEDLATELARLQDSHGSDFTERMSIWEKLDPLAAEFEVQGAAAVTAIGDGRGWRIYSIRRVTETASLTAGTHDSVRARDVQGTVRRVSEVGTEIPYTRQFVERERERSSGPDGVQAVAAHLQRAADLQGEMAKLLAQLRDVPGESDPELQDATRGLAAQQGALQERQRGLSEEVKTIENALPVSTGEAAKTMAGAGASMGRAHDALDLGEAIPGEGHQRRAIDLVRETAEHLQQSMEKQSQMQQSMAAMRGEQRGENGDEHGDSQTTATEPEIPAPELFKTAEAYREALLEGMAGEVPEEFEALKKRFYEDLVRQ